MVSLNERVREEKKKHNSAQSSQVFQTPKKNGNRSWGTCAGFLLLYRLVIGHFFFYEENQNTLYHLFWHWSG